MSELYWCIDCELRVVDPQPFYMREKRDPDLYCARCRAAINVEFEEV